MAFDKKEMTKPRQPEPVVAAPDPQTLRQRIAEVAYGRYVQRGRTPGRHVEDWLEAERIVREEGRNRATGPLAAPVPARGLVGATSENPVRRGEIRSGR